MTSILMGAVCQGLLWAVMAIGVYLTYRILDFADLTAEGSFTLGASVAARLITSGLNPVASTLAALVAGILAGSITGFLNTCLKVPPLLSGILTMTGLYSINLRIMGKANLPLMNSVTIISTVENMGLSKKNAAIAVGIAAVIVVILILWWFFNTELGYVLRATGDNPHMIRAQGVNTNKLKVLGLIMSNALIAFSGALVCQYNGFSDVGMGTGVIVIGLASVIIGEVVFSDKNNALSLVAVTLGSVLYRIIIAIVLSLGLAANDLRLISSIMLAIALSIPLFREKISIFVKKNSGKEFLTKQVRGG